MISSTPRSVLQINAQASKTLEHRGKKIIPISQTIRLRIPGLPFEFLWNRPAVVLIKMENGSEQILPVHDGTRWIQVAMVIISALFALLLIMRQKAAKS